MDFSTLDFIVFALYALIILSIGLFVSRQKKGETKSAEDYFKQVNHCLGGRLVLR